MSNSSNSANSSPLNSSEGNATRSTLNSLYHDLLEGEAAIIHAKKKDEFDELDENDLVSAEQHIGKALTKIRNLLSKTKKQLQS